MTLFPDLPMPAAALPTLRYPRQPVPWRVAVRAALSALLQIPIRAPLRALDRDDAPSADDKPIQRIVSAAEAPRVKTVALSSIFNTQDVRAAVETLRKSGRFGDAAGFTPTTRIERDGDRVRLFRIPVQDTAEWQEKERIRRAKQRPPRPTKQATTRGKKVRKWDGETVE